MNAVVAALNRDSAAVWFGNFGSVSLRFALNVLIARLGGADQMGVYVALAAFTFVIARLTDFGLPNALVYFVRLNRHTTRRCVLVCLMHSAFMLPASIGLLRAIVFFGLTNSDSSHLIATTWLPLSALSTVQLLGGLISQMLIPLNGFKSYGFVMTLSPIVSMASCMAFGTGIDARHLVIAVLAGESCAAAAGLAMVLRALPHAKSSGPLPSVVAIYQYAIKSYVGTSLKALGQRADRIVLSWFLPNSLLAAYAVAISLRDNASLPVTTHSMLLRNQLIDREMNAAGRDSARDYLRRELIRWSAIAASIAAGLALAAPLFVPALYGHQFRSTVGLFIVLSATLPMIAIATLCWTGLLSAAKPGVVSFGLIFGGMTNLIALYCGARLGGAMGASWGALIASIIAAAWWLVVSFKRRS